MIVHAPLRAKNNWKPTPNAIAWRPVPLPIAIDDVKKVLSAGCPVHVSMNTGSDFSDVGRDGEVQCRRRALQAVTAVTPC